MPRKRQIKPTIFSNEELGAPTTDPLVMILFEALWCLADREGRLEDRPLKLVAFAFPYRQVDDPAGMLQWLHDRGFIDRYSVQGKPYIQIVNFVEHQKGSGIHPNEVPSVIPPKESTYLTDHLGGPHGPPHGAPLDNLGGPHGRPKAHRSSALHSLHSLHSFPSLENGGPKQPPVEKEPVERRIWEDGVDLLVTRAKMKEEAARPLLGRLAKQYSERLLAEAIAVTLAENPAEPKAFLIGVLKARSNPIPEATVGKAKVLSPEERAAEEEVFRSRYRCIQCLDTGEIAVVSQDDDAIGGMKLVPCACGQPPRPLFRE